uniref:Uncharacterized protein n=1 Tax=Picea sitchensis TaxID=3332 RepID=A9NRB8_PICSI|nr:unknown [Picea sitchensis]
MSWKKILPLTSLRWFLRKNMPLVMNLRLWRLLKRRKRKQLLSLFYRKAQKEDL